MSFFKRYKRANAVKTVLLGAVATGLFFWAAVRYWGADPEELKVYFKATLLLLVVTGVAGAIMGFIIAYLRK